MALRTAIVLVVCLGAYSNSLLNGFVYDDRFQVVENPWIRDVASVPRMFLSSVWFFRFGISGSNYYRPLMHLIYLIAYHTFGLRAWGFHLVNILFHVGNSLLVLRLAARCLGESREEGGLSRRPSPGGAGAGLAPGVGGSGLPGLFSPPLMAALLFALHPIHTEAVTWVAGLPEISFTFFSLLSFHLYLESGGRWGGAYPLSLISFFLAALCKEPALMLPLVLIAHDHLLRQDRGRFRVPMTRYLPYGAVAALYLALRVHALGGLAPANRHAGLSAYQDLINIFPLLALYCGKLLLPIHLNAFPVYHPIDSVLGREGLLSILVGASLAAAGLVAFRRDRAVLFSLLLVVLPLLPVLYLPAIPQYLSERYLYLPSFGFVMLVTQLLAWAKRRIPGKATPWFLLGCALLPGLYFTGTFTRNPAWRDDYRLWTDTVRKSPDGAIPHNNLAVVLDKREELDEAVRHLRLAIALDPAYADAHDNLGNVYMEKGLFGSAVREFEAAVRLDPANRSYREDLLAAEELARVSEEGKRRKGL